MEELSTERLEGLLFRSGFAEYRKRCPPESGFAGYYLELLSQKGLSRSRAIAGSGLEVHYGYQLLNGRKQPGRDKVLCLCIGGSFSIEETNRVLEWAGHSRLYAKRPRDAAVMLCLNRHMDTIWRVNEVLAENRLPLLS